MFLIVFFMILIGTFVAQNKKIADDYKVGYFSVAGIIFVLSIILSAL